VVDSDPSIPAAPARSWSLPAGSVLEALGVDRSQGLTPTQVRRRRRHYGPNRLRATKRQSAWRTLWNQLASPIVALLAAAAIVAIVFNEPLEAMAIGVSSRSAK
jgi:Ca2+-transporting ATPase